MSKLKVISTSEAPNPSPVERLATRLYTTFDPMRPSARRWKDLHGWQRQMWRDHAKALLTSVETYAADERIIDAGVSALADQSRVDSRSNKTKAGDVFAAMIYEMMED